MGWERERDVMERKRKTEEKRNDYEDHKRLGHGRNLDHGQHR